MKNDINISLTCDNDYIVLLATLLKSIEKNHVTPEKINAFIVNDGISSSNKKKIEESISQKMFNIVWVDLKTAIPRNVDFPLPTYTYPVNIYARLFIPQFVPPEVSKVIYFDVDMVVLEDVSKLFNTDLEGRPLGAVQDPRVTHFDNHWGGVLNFKELNLDGRSPYFNSGMLLIDCYKWREENVSINVLNIVKKNMKYAAYTDQYGLNIFFANRWKLLDSRWNHFVSEQSIEHPFLLHFVGRKPIYTTYNGLPEYKPFFDSYSALTKFKDFKTIKEGKRYWKKIRIAMSNVSMKFAR